MVSELEHMDKSVKKLDKSYKALINASFSRVVLDDGKGGQLFDVQLYPKDDSVGENKKYDMRAYFYDPDRVYKNGVTCEEICEFIGGEMKDIIEGGESYVRKSLRKGKRPYWNSSEYEYKPQMVK